ESSPTRRIVVCISILTAERIRKVRMVEDIEKFRPELRSEALPKLPGLCDREIYVAESGVAEDVAAHGAESAEGRRNHEGLPVGIATETSERSRRQAGVISAVHS